MKFNDHGAETNNIYKEFNVVKPIKTIDFSTNTNVIELNKNTKAMINSIDLATYPDSTNQKVIKSISLNIKNDSTINISRQNLLVTNGSNEAIYIIASYFMNMEVAILQPTYPEYEKAFTAYHAKVNHCFALDDLVNPAYKCVVICNPNNPTGKYIKWKELSLVIERLESMDITLVIDEAYIDFLLLEDPCSVDKYNYCMTHKNLIILRSLTKIYQIAGLRLAYVMSHHYWIDLIEKRQPSWSVNSIASTVAGEYLDDKNIVKDTKNFYGAEGQRVRQALIDLEYEVIETDVNFYLLKTSNDIELITYLLTKGIVVRHTRNHIGLEGQYVRIALKSVEENNYLIDMLRRRG